MRVFRKRSWSSLGLNVTPLIDVIFLMTIFFLMTINFSDVISRAINLPRADEASAADRRPGRITITITSADTAFVNNRSMPLSAIDAGIGAALAGQSLDPQTTTVQVLADENLPYEAVQSVLQTAGQRGISRIEFSALIEKSQPLRGAGL